MLQRLRVGVLAGLHKVVQVACDERGGLAVRLVQGSGSFRSRSTTTCLKRGRWLKLWRAFDLRSDARSAAERRGSRLIEIKFADRTTALWSKNAGAHPGSHAEHRLRSRTSVFWPPRSFWTKRSQLFGTTTRALRSARPGRKTVSWSRRCSWAAPRCPSVASARSGNLAHLQRRSTAR